jgi:Gamma tubulin complex component C-terminal/Gamma tubulin complex component N-terminal
MAREPTSILNEDPFILDGLLEFPDLVSEPRSIWQPFQPESNLFAFDIVPAGKKQDILLELRPDFFALARDEPFPEIDSFADSTSESETGDAVSKENPNKNEKASEDVWLWEDVATGTRENQLVNWDTFLNPETETPRSAYLSEAGPACFDAFLAIYASQTISRLPKVIAQHEDFLRSVFELGLGRDSLLYRYDPQQAKFIPVSEDFRISGISFDAQHHVVQEVLEMGNTMRQLEAFVAKPKSRPLSIALSATISVILYAIKAELQASERNVQSTLQLDDILARPKCLVQTLKQLVGVLKITDSDIGAIVKLLKESEELASCHTWLTQILHEILGRISAPWISTIEAELGLHLSPSASQAQALLSYKSRETQKHTSESSQESPLSPVEELITESRRCLGILRDQQVDHPVLNPSRKISSKLSWEASWEHILRVQEQANAYEQGLKKAILDYGQGNPIEPDDEASDKTAAFPEKSENLVMMDLDTPNVLDRGLGGQTSPSESTLSQLTITALRAGSDFSEFLNQSELYPLLSHSLPLSLLPLLNAQSRLLSFSTLHLVFKTHSLRHHLSVQYRFQLLSDGLFAARVNRALFDPDQYTSEGRRSNQGATGLRLQARDAWPPASSELRLVLMGILSESYHTTLQSKNLNNDELPGNLSFAIRNLSPQELEKCKDPSSIEALDFLRLQYKPPHVLESIITPTSLGKYDKIFKYRLRLLRLQALAQSLLRGVACRNGKIDRTTQRFRINIQHFISTLAAYSNNDAIGVEWARFQQSLRDIEAAIDRGDYEGTLAKAGSLSRLEKLHEEVLDRIMRGLFLDCRQAQVREVIDGIFGIILRFSANITHGENDVDGGGVGGVNEDTKSMHMEFKKQVGRLARYLRSQGSCSASSSSSMIGKRRLVGESDGNGSGALLSDSPPPFEHLLVKLDMFGYYS